MGILNGLFKEKEYLFINPETVTVYETYDENNGVFIGLKNPYTQPITFNLWILVPPTVTMEINDKEYVNGSIRFQETVVIEPGNEHNNYAFFKHTGELPAELRDGLYAYVFVKFEKPSLIGGNWLGKAQEIKLITR